MGWAHLGCESFSLLIAALLAGALAACSVRPAGTGDAGHDTAEISPAPPHPDAKPILAAPPQACAVSADSLKHHDDWHGSGIEVDELVPDGWDPERHSTLIFLHGDNTAPDQYHCYRELLASCCVRSLYPRQPTSARSGMEPLGWDQRHVHWLNLAAIYFEVIRQQNKDRIFIGGHSIGAYTSMLAAGARSRVRRDRVGNCTRRSCRPLRAAGYISISGWPAQSSRARRPFWFAKRAFGRLQPNRYVAYGSLDTSRTDSCLHQTPPTCRGDAYEVDRERADELNLSLDVIEGFEHKHFMCNDDWRESHEHPEQMRDFVERIGDWIAETAPPGGATGTAPGPPPDPRPDRGSEI